MSIKRGAPPEGVGGIVSSSPGWALLAVEVAVGRRSRKSAERTKPTNATGPATKRALARAWPAPPPFFRRDYPQRRVFRAARHRIVPPPDLSGRRRQWPTPTRRSSGLSSSITASNAYSNSCEARHAQERGSAASPLVMVVIFQLREAYRLLSGQCWASAPQFSLFVMTRQRNLVRLEKQQTNIHHQAVSTGTHMQGGSSRRALVSTAT